MHNLDHDKRKAADRIGVLIWDRELAELGTSAPNKAKVMEKRGCAAGLTPIPLEFPGLVVGAKN